jgi:hypothetical protein
MFHVNNLKQLEQIASGIGNGGVAQFDENETVWRGDDGSYCIGEFSEFDEDEQTQYVEAGTVGEYRR